MCQKLRNAQRSGSRQCFEHFRHIEEGFEDQFQLCDVLSIQRVLIFTLINNQQLLIVISAKNIQKILKKSPESSHLLNAGVKSKDRLNMNRALILLQQMQDKDSTFYRVAYIRSSPQKSYQQEQSILMGKLIPAVGFDKGTKNAQSSLAFLSSILQNEIRPSQAHIEENDRSGRAQKPATTRFYEQKAKKLKTQPSTISNLLGGKILFSQDEQKAMGDTIRNARTCRIVSEGHPSLPSFNQMRDRRRMREQLKDFLDKKQMPMQKARISQHPPSAIELSTARRTLKTEPSKQKSLKRQTQWIPGEKPFPSEALSKRMATMFLLTETKKEIFEWSRTGRGSFRAPNLIG